MIGAFKMCYKGKLVGWTLQQIDNNSNEDLGKLNVDLFQGVLWCVATWHELVTGFMNFMARQGSVHFQHLGVVKN